MKKERRGKEHQVPACPPPRPEELIQLILNIQSPGPCIWALIRAAAYQHAKSLMLKTKNVKGEVDATVAFLDVDPSPSKVD